MNRYLKKLLVLLPVLLLGIWWLYDHANALRHASGKRLFLFALSFLVLYGLFLIDVIRKRQSGFLQISVHASFFVYIFVVLTLTGYFILYREVSSADWWQRIMLRIERKDHVNLELFKIFSIYKISNTQIIGNLIMLLPLGIYLPLLYRRASGFFGVVIISFLVACTIEGLQLITSFRSADVDDIMLNTLGACIGFLVYKFFQIIWNGSSGQASNSSALA